MIEFIINYWVVVLPTALTGTALLVAMKKKRDKKVRQEKALMLVPIKGKQRE